MNDINENITNLVNNIHEAINFGFSWNDYKDIVKQIFSELNEVDEVLNSNESKSRLSEEIGDVIHSLIALTIYFNMESKLNNKELFDFFSNNKLSNQIDRIDHIKIILKMIDKNQTDKLREIFYNIYHMCKENELHFSNIVIEADKKFKLRIAKLQKIVEEEYHLDNITQLEVNDKLRLWSKCKSIVKEIY